MKMCGVTLYHSIAVTNQLYGLKRPHNKIRKHATGIYRKCTQVTLIKYTERSSYEKEIEKNVEILLKFSSRI